MVNEGLLSIGRFSRQCRLSVKRLRHYDEIGLLPAALVDPDSGYRYYTPEQARTALQIGLLRELGIPLPAIAEIVNSGEPGKVLEAERRRVEEDLEQRRRLLSTLQRVIDTGLDPVEVGLVQEPALRLAAVTDTCSMDELGSTMGRCVGRLALLEGFRPPVIGQFPLEMDEQMTITIGFESAAGTVDIPAASAAVATHLGPFEELTLTYHGLFAWIYERGLTPSGTVRETYLTDPGTTPQAQLVTRIAVPLRETP